MKKIFNINLLLLAMFIACQCCLTSCSDDETAGGTPVITAVRLCPPEKADSTFTKSPQGQTIAIIGENLNNTMYVYINDQKVYFNPTLNTDHSIIVTVPTETKGFKLTAFNTGLKDEIRVETTHGTAVYAFKVLGGYPTISRVQCQYPRETGDVLNVYGLNLEQIERMYFFDKTPEEITLSEVSVDEMEGLRVDVDKYDVIINDHHLNTKNQTYETTSQLALTIPAMSFERGTLVIACAAGTTYIGYSKTPGLPVIKSISSEMPVVGQQVIVKGNEFVQVESVTYGDVVLSAEEYSVAATEDAITFTFSRIPSVGSNPVLAITTPGGTAEVGFYDYRCLLSDMEEETVADMTWDPNVEYVTSDVAPFGGTGRMAHFNSYGQWWGQMVFFAHDWDFTPFTLPDFEVIPANAPASDVYIAYEVYDNNSDFNNGGAGYQGYFRLSLWDAANNNSNNPSTIQYDNFDWEDYNEGTFFNPDGPVLQDIDGEAHCGQWYRSVVPLSALTTVDDDGKATGRPYATYADFYNAGLSVMRLMSLTQGTKSGNVDVYLDNIRIYYHKK